MNTIQNSEMIVTLNGKNAVSVNSLDEAVRIAAKFRDEYDYGFGMGATKYYNLKVGRVLQGSNQIARIHYNGRVEVTVC